MMHKVYCPEFAPPEALQRIEVPVPEPQAGEIQVAISAAGVGFVDGLMVQGLYQVNPPLPYYPGSEFAGVVSALGEGVTGLEAGDRVMGVSSGGAFGDYLTIPAAAVVKVPQQLDLTTAAGMAVLKKQDAAGAIRMAVHAATRRSEELGRGSAG